ncbi:DUF3916 domain-containing protein [Neobacillus pocheonensis]|uniref:DUF3916 domain-containing protein n=1 Tax=Neobacillus pocheonensis TaxID=363869 RepID=UPI003D2A6930
MKIKKVRGLKTKIIKFYKNFEEDTKVFPADFDGYFEYHLPNKGTDWLNSPKVQYRVKSEYFQFLIDRTQHLIKLKPADCPLAKVLLMIDFHYWYATKVYIHSVIDEPEFEWNNGDVSVIKLKNNRDFSKEWNVKIPSGFNVIGTKSTIINKDYFEPFEIYGGETWYIGEL